MIRLLQGDALAMLKTLPDESVHCCVTSPLTVAWVPACTCDSGDPIPCTVLDPFSGAGTTGLVATRLNLHYTGIDLKPDYIARSERRIVGDNPLFNEVVA